MRWLVPALLALPAAAGAQIPLGPEALDVPRARLPVVGDFDGDGRDDLGAWRPLDGAWFARRPDGLPVVDGVRLGQAGDVPLPADYDGDGRADLAVYRPSTGQWFARRATGEVIFAGLQLGAPGVIPVPGDYDGDGRVEPAVYLSGFWATRRPGQRLPRITWLGFPGDAPVPADYDGDGRTDRAVWRPRTSAWWAWSDAAGFVVAGVRLGGAGATPLPGDFDGDGRAEPGVWLPDAGTWRVRLGGGEASATLAPSAVVPSLLHFGDRQRPGLFDGQTDAWSALDPDGRRLSSVFQGQASELQADSRYTTCDRSVDFPFDFTTDDVYRPNPRGVCMQWRNPTTFLLGGAPRAVGARWFAYGMRDWTAGLVATGTVSFDLAGGDAPTGNALDWSRFEVALAEAGGDRPRDFLVEVQAFDADGDPVGPRSNPIVVHWLQASVEFVFPEIDVFDLHHPVVDVDTFSGLRPTACPDAENRYLVREPMIFCQDERFADHPYCTVGNAVRWVPSDETDCGFLPDVICEAVGGAIDLFADIVDGLSAAYDGILAAAAQLLVVAIEATGIDCDPTCQAVAMVAVQAGAAALGLPPSLPDFDALVEDGFDYLVAECGAFVADATGAPQGLTDEACDVAVEAVRDAARAQRDEAEAGLYLVPDPAWQALPAKARLRVHNDDDGWSERVRLELRDEARILSPATLDIPAMAPGQAFDIPVVFTRLLVNGPGETGSPTANWSRRASEGPVRLVAITATLEDGQPAAEALHRAAGAYDLFTTAPACP
ncbi:MAG: VCBS repeat-containing protein [Myxococcales bacterium]|nr:VCBS repeat-containing protein [Myxococcales bacterium]